MLLIAALIAFVVQAANAQQTETNSNTATPAKSSATTTGSAPDAQTFLKSVAEKLGILRSIRRIDALNYLEYWATGYSYALGQQYKPDGPWPAFKVTYHASIDFAIPAMRVDMTRSNPDGPIQGGGGLPLAAPQRQIQVVSGNTAWNESEPGAGLVPGQGVATPAPGTASDRLLQIWLTPYGAVKLALKAGADLKLTKENGASVLTFPFSGTTMKIIVNENKLVDRVETMVDNPVLGDMATEADYSKYDDYGDEKSGTMFPGHIVIKQGGFPILDLTTSKDDPNNPYMIFPVPDNIEKAFAQGPAPVKVDVQKVGDGVWFLAGGTHNSLAIEFKNYVALFECPLNDERSLAVIDAVKKTIPNKPIKYAINTHHHFDHSGGLRSCVAEGATVITQDEDKPYFEKVLAMPHTIKPDREAQVHKKLVIEGVADKRVLTDGTQTLELYHLHDSNHADTLLIGYLPKAKLLIEADSYNPAPPNAAPGPVSKESVVLDDNIKRLNLDVQQIAPIHGRLVTINDFRKAIGEGSNSGN